MSKRNKKGKVLGLKLRPNSSPDVREDEKRRKDFEIILQKIDANAKELKSLSLPPPSLPLANYYPALIQALSRNKSLTSIDASRTQDISPEQTEEILKVLDQSNNFCLRRVDFSGSTQNKTSVKAILKYIKQHLHIIDFKFTDPFSDPTIDTKSDDKRSSFKITNYLATNRKMHRFLKGETTKFECQTRNIVVTQGFIKPEWGKRMTCLDLTGNRLFHLPNFFIDFTLLTELMLANNDLCKLPRWIGKLKNLRILDATNNSIRAIPDSVYQLEELRTLNLASNNIDRVPLFLGNMAQLRILSLTANPVMNIPRSILKTAELGDPTVIQYLQHNLDRVVSHQLQQESVSLPDDYFLPECPEIDENEEIAIDELVSILSSQEVSALHNRKRQILENTGSPPSQLSGLNEQVLDDPKHLSSVLEPECRSNCTVIEKISDFIWCGLNSGSVCVWDSRTCRFKQTIEAHDHGIVCILEIPFPHLESWSGDNLGMVNIYDLRKTKSIQIEVFELGITSMVYVKDIGEVWVASGTSISRVSVRTRGVIGRHLLVDAPVRVMNYCARNIWVACQTGIVSIYCTDGTLLRSFCAHSEPILAMINAGDFVWTATKSEIKIWKIQPIKLGVFIVACHDILSTGDVNPPFVVSKDESSVFSLGGEETQGFILQSTASGELVNCFSHEHEGAITSLTFSVSPDRLWSSSSNGVVSCYELKRGKKTIQRMQEQHMQDELSDELGVIEDITNVESLRLELSESDDEQEINFEIEEGRDGPPPMEPHPLALASPPPMEPHPSDHPSDNLNGNTIYDTELSVDPVLSEADRSSLTILAQPTARVSMVEQWDDLDDV